MNQAITTRSPSSLPAPLQTRALADLLGVYRSRIERTERGKCLITEDLAPTPAHRQALQQRRDEIRSSICRSDPEHIVPRIARMFLRFPSADRVAAVGTTAAYAADLVPFPLWAIDAGIISILKSKEPRGAAYVPSSVEVRQAVQRVLVPIIEEASEIGKVLDAEIRPLPKPAMRSAVNDLFKKLQFELKQKLRPEERGKMSPEEIAQAVQLQGVVSAGVPDPRPMPKFSSDHARRLGIVPIDSATSPAHRERSAAA